jgi:type IV pilus assembly protein PilC
VIIVASIVSAILLLFVVPQFQELFCGFGTDLPAFTLFVIGLSELLQAWWWVVVLSAIIFMRAASVQAKRRSSAFNCGLDVISLKIPVVEYPT